MSSTDLELDIKSPFLPFPNQGHDISLPAGTHFDTTSTMLSEYDAPCRRLSSLCEDSDVDFSTFHFLASNTVAPGEQAADSMDVDSRSPAARILREEIDLEAKTDTNPGRATENAEDTLNGLRPGSSDPLLFTDGTDRPAKLDVATSPPIQSHASHATPRPIQPRPSSVHAATLAFADIEAIAAETGQVSHTRLTDPLPERLDYFNNRDMFQSPDVQFAARRRSQSVPPNDMSFHRQLHTWEKQPIGRPNHRPAGSIQRVHPYGNAVLKRFSGNLQIPQNQRHLNAPQQTSRHSYLEAIMYTPGTSTHPATLDMSLPNQTNLESNRQHPDLSMGRGGLRPRPNPAFQPTHSRQVALTEAQYLCERMLYRLALASDGTRRDAVMLGQDPALEMYVSLPPWYSD
jgi:hypothetical protein